MANNSAIICFVLAIIFIISAVLITISSANLFAFNQLDAFFANSYSFSTWASVISWLLVVLILIAFFLYAYYYLDFGAEASALETIQTTYTTVSGWTIFFIFFLLVLLFFVGVLSALTASNMKKSSNYNSMNAAMRTAYDDASISAILSLVAGSIVIIWFLVDLFYYFSPSTKDEKVETKVDDKNIELKEIKKLVEPTK